MVVGREKFFVSIFWWSFLDVERGSLLAQTTGKLEQAGLVSYFLDLQLVYVQKVTAASTRKRLMEAGMAGSHAHVSGTGVSLVDDAVMSESFMVFLYGISMAVIGFIGELVIKSVLHWYPFWSCYILSGCSL